jgi:hypothetical protein
MNLGISQLYVVIPANARKQEDRALGRDACPCSTQQQAHGERARTRPAAGRRGVRYASNFFSRAAMSSGELSGVKVAVKRPSGSIT